MNFLTYFLHKNLNFSHLIKSQMKNSLNYIQDLKNRFDALNKFFELSNISFTFVSFSSGGLNLPKPLCLHILYGCSVYE